MSVDPEQISQQPTDEEILAGIKGFLLPFAKLVKGIAAAQGLTPQELLAQYERDATERGGEGDSERRGEGRGDPAAPRRAARAARAKTGAGRPARAVPPAEDGDQQAAQGGVKEAR